MKLMLRVIGIFIAVLISGPAFADYGATPSFMYNGSGIYLQSASAACGCANGGLSGSTCSGAAGRTYTIDSSNPPKCNICDKTGCAPPQAPSRTWSCPYGGSLAGPNADGGFICIGANIPSACPKSGSDAGTFKVTTAYSTARAAGSAVAVRLIPDGQLGSAMWCSGGCQVVPDMTAFAKSGYCGIADKASPNGYWALRCDVPMVNGAGPCQQGIPSNSPLGAGPFPPPGVDPPEPAAKNTFDGQCPTGSMPGGVDPSGMTVCVGDGKKPTTTETETKTPTKTVTDSAGNTVSTDVSTKTNSDGSTTTTTTTTTTKPDGTKTVDVKSDTGAATGGAQGTKDSKDQADLCAKNPSLNICKNSQVTGTCGQISCTGDAIQCATLRAAAAMQCKQKQDDDDLKASPLTALGASTAAGNDPLSGTLPTKGNGGNVTMPSSLDNSGWLGGGAAFNDVTFSIHGKSITVPLAKATGYLVGLRYALMIVALLVSFRMLSGVILRD